MDVIIGFLLWIDGIVYNIIDWIYDIFNYLAGLNLFKESVYMNIVQRIYVILGMVMLFILAYTLLKAVVNPENFAKGEQSFPKLIQNVLVSLVIIVLLPTVFSVAYNVQNSILTYKTIPKLILGDDKTSEYINPEGENTYKDSQGKKMALYIFSSVFHENANKCASGTISSKDFKVVGESACAEEILGNGWWFVTNGDPLSETVKKLEAGETDFTEFRMYSESTGDGKIEYFPIVSTIIGIFTAYVLINYCFDMALRVIKLMFFQIIAPVPVICRILPGGKMKDVFSDWMKKTISTFVEVFIRIAIIYLGVFLIDQIVTEFPNLPNGGLSFTQLLVCKVLLIMGVVIFIRQAPKLISEMFHLDSGSMKLGIMDKLAMGGGLAAASLVGGAVTGFGRNAVTAGKNVKNAKGIWGKTKALVSGVGSAVAGGASAGARAGWAGKGAKNFGDVKNATSKGATGAADAKKKRDYYKAKAKIARANGDFSTTLGERIGDGMSSVGEYFGLNSVQGFIDDNKVIDDIAGKKKGVRTSVENLIDGEANKSSSTFNYGGFSATELRQKLLDIEDAKAGKNGMSVAQAQQIYDDYRYKFSQALQNVALSKGSYEALSRGDQAKLAEAYAQGEALKETLSRNLSKEYVKAAGFNAGNVSGDLDVTAGPLKDIGDELDIQRAKNNAEIAKREREKREKEGN